MSMGEYLHWVAYRAKYGPMMLHMRIDRAAAVIAQAHRGGTLESRMPWGVSRPAPVPGHVSSEGVAVASYTDEQLKSRGLYRDEGGTIRRKVSNAGKRMVAGRLVSPGEIDKKAQLE